ncbi:MAG: hypothetical protein IJ461_03875 [Clostridia bacterium]|nr:hypothetical protein [Clostridia bacterium]
MFLRKLLVMALPLGLCMLLCLVFPMISGMGFFNQVIKGILLGGALCVILPVCGASRRRETFGKSLWIPAMVLLVVILFQYLTGAGMLYIPALSFLATSDPSVVLIESTFLAYMLGHLLRWK